MSDSAFSEPVQACDVLIAGAGPSGLLLARLLAQSGVSVLVVDPLRDLSHAAFSSAALPQEAIQHFRLPAQVQAAPWRGWQLLGPGQREAREWLSEQPLGAV